MVAQVSVFVLAIALAVPVTGLAQTVDLGEVESQDQVEEASLHGASSPTSDRSAVPPEQPQQRLSPLRRGDILMARKMYREAIETYQEGIRDAAMVYNKIGIAYHQLMDFKSALRYYRKAIELDPTYAQAMNNIGTVRYAQRNPKGAIKEYRKALKQAPNSASIYSNLGTAYFARKKYQQAFEAYQKAVDLDPNVFEHRGTAGSILQERSVKERAKFHFYLAKTYAKAGAYDRALLYMRKALEEGFRDRDKFVNDPDFAGLQENEVFQTLLATEYRVL